MTDVEVEIGSFAVKSCAGGFVREVGFSEIKSSADGLSRIVKVFKDTTSVEDSKEWIGSEGELIVDWITGTEVEMEYAVVKWSLLWTCRDWAIDETKICLVIDSEDGDEGGEEGGTGRVGDVIWTKSDEWYAASWEGITKGKAETVVAWKSVLENAGDKGRRDVSRFDEEISIEESNFLVDYDGPPVFDVAFLQCDTSRKYTRDQQGIFDNLDR